MTLTKALVCVSAIIACMFVLSFHEYKYYEVESIPAQYDQCADIGGPNVWFKYDEKGNFVCLNKRGGKLK